MMLNSELSRLETHESDYTSRINNSKFFAEEEYENKIFDSLASLPYDEWPALKEISQNQDQVSYLKQLLVQEREKRLDDQKKYESAKLQIT